MILHAETLGFSYPRRHLFDGWCADFDAGLTWLQGPNGSGKSTLLELLGGALPLRSGKLSVRGIDAAVQPVAYRRDVFWCGTGPIAFNHLRPSEYFGFIRGLYPRFDSEALAEHIAGFGLTAQLDTPLGHLSAGTVRKVWLAAAFVAGTAAVLIDEPVNTLDAGSVEHLERVLLRGATDPARAWVVTSHEPLGQAGGLARVIRLPVRAGVG